MGERVQKNHPVYSRYLDSIQLGVVTIITLSSLAEMYKFGRFHALHILMFSFTRCVHSHRSEKANKTLRYFNDDYQVPPALILL